ncbi:MAG TPA: ester cyclase [Anaerolineales bacterium]|nr:ester cyclase [Anaerolineales bacterium]
MSEELNKSIVRRIWKEIWQEGNLATIDELIDSNHVLHAYPEDLAYGSGAEGFKQLVSANRANLPDAQLTVEDLIAEGNKVVTRYTVCTSSSAMTTGIWIDRIQDNQVVESWVDWDRLGFFRQLGLISPPGETANE